MLALISVCIRLGPLALQQTDSVSLVWSAIAEPRVDLFVLCSSLPARNCLAVLNCCLVRPTPLKPPGPQLPGSAELLSCRCHV